jgi:hypothetical protein
MSPVASTARRTVTAIAALLEYWLMSSPLRFDKDARRVVFQFLVEESLALSFVPGSNGPLIHEGVVEGAAATVWVHPQALLRMLMDPDARPAEFPWSIEGDATALQPIAAALAACAGPKNVVSVRVQDEGSST